MARSRAKVAPSPTKANASKAALRTWRRVATKVGNLMSRSAKDYAPCADWVEVHDRMDHLITQVDKLAQQKHLPDHAAAPREYISHLDKAIAHLMQAGTIAWYRGTDPTHHDTAEALKALQGRGTEATDVG